MFSTLVRTAKLTLMVPDYEAPCTKDLDSLKAAPSTLILRYSIGGGEPMTISGYEVDNVVALELVF